MRVALIEPDIPQNVGAAIRAAACFGAGVDIIEPCGFPMGDRDLKRVAMDYANLAWPRRHASWTSFRNAVGATRLVLFTTKADELLWNFSFRRDDIFVFGRESAGAPEHVHAVADARLLIPLAPGARSLNVAVAAAVALAEARRQLGF